MAEKRSKYSMQTVQRSIQVLKSFSTERKRLTLTDFHQITGLSKSTLQRILITLVDEGLLVKNEQTKEYQLGLELYFLGNLVEKNSSLLSVSLPIMQELQQKTGETIILNTVYQNKRKCIGAMDSVHKLVPLIEIGQTSPLHSGASAKVLLANMEEDELNSILENIKLDAFTENTITSREKLRKELERIREQGYAISSGERVKGAFSISAPIFNRFKQVIASVAIVIPTVRLEEFNLVDLIQLIVQGADKISKKIDRITSK